MQFYNRIPADYLKKITIWQLKRDGYLNGFRSFRISWKMGDSITGSMLISTLVASDFDKEEGRLPLAVEKWICFLYSQIDDYGNRQNFDYKVPITITYCHYGGWRYWFQCLFCGRRIGVLYKRADYFACRHCNYLTYESKNLSGTFKAFGRIISAPELDELAARVKRQYYKGKMTKIYQRYLLKVYKFKRAYAGHIGAIGS